MRNIKIQRREFIQKSALGLVSAGVSGNLLQTISFSQQEKYAIVSRTLGRTGLKVPLISFGVMNTDNPAMLHKALEFGIKHYDTAHRYLRGNSEKVIGEIMKETGKRKEVYIATKLYFNRDKEKNIFLKEGKGDVPGATAENLGLQLETSLERLQTDYVDILYIHSCYSPEMVNYEELMNAIVKVKKEGKARFIGVSTHANEPEVLRAAADSDVYDVVQVAYNYLQKNREDIKKAIAYAASKDVGIITMKTIGGNQMQQDKSVTINRLAALKWVLNDKNVTTVIPGMTAFDQMEMNMSVMANLELTEEEKKDLVSTEKLSGILYCQNCRTCISTCPQRVEIPTLMRAYMYDVGYGNSIQAEMTVADVPSKKGLKTCRYCTACSADCRYGINIASRLNHLSGKYC